VKSLPSNRTEKYIVKEELIGKTVNIYAGIKTRLKGCTILDIAEGLMKIECQDGNTIWIGVGTIHYIELA